MIEKWKIISTEDASPSSWLPVLKQKVILPNNTIVDDYYVATFGNVVMVLPITKDNKIILVKQYKHGVGEILIELPAGSQHDQLSIKESALEELEEETGIKTTLSNLISLGVISNNPTKTNHITYGFIANNISFNSKQTLDITEDIEIMKIPSRDVIKMILSGEIWVGDSVSFIMKAYLMFPQIFK